MMIKEVKIDDNVSYLTSSENPLSSEVVILNYSNRKMLYDVGDNKEVLKYIDETCDVVISHFHQDHCGNLNLIDFKDLYVSKYTFDHLKKGIIVQEKIDLSPYEIFDISSSHCKGSLAVKVLNKYLLVSDGIYCSKQGYNVQLLKKQIELIESMDVDYLFISHNSNPLIKKGKALSFLKEIYQKRRKDSPYIVVNQ